MALDWFVFAITATILWSITAIIVKFVRVNYIKSPIGYMIIITPASLIGFALLLFGKFQIPSTKMLIYIIISAILGFIAYWLYLIAIHEEEISKVTTLFGLQPLMVLILATLFLKEALTIKDYFAFPLIIIGGMLISIKKTGEKFNISKGFMFVFVSISIYSVQSLLFKLVSEVNFVSVGLIRYASWIIITIILLISSKTIRRKTKEDLKQINKKRLALMYGADSIAIIGVILSYIAIQRGAVSLVTLVEGTQGLFVIILTVLVSIFIPKILKEEITKKTISLKIISALLMITGLYLIVI